MDEFSTVILRFRDLVTDRGDTIRRHQSIAGGDKGYVWWGWWHKLGETVPEDAFRKLSDKAEAGGFDLYLLDTGQELLYKAKCSEIYWDAKLKEIPTKEIDATPEYYNKKSYLAWFKLSNFEGVSNPESVLHGFSYVKVDEFFLSRQSRYTAFYNKQVRSTHELQQQNRTIWFVRPFASTDSTHEISLLDPRSITPENFSPDYFESSSRNLLWVSDLHFSVDDHHAFPLKSDDIRFDLGHQIENVVKGLNMDSIAGLIVSGDITWQAIPEEFEQAKHFVTEGLNWMPMQSDQIAICPGNHDLKFSTNPSKKGQPVTIVKDDYKAAYSKFYQDIFYLAPNRFLSCGRRFLLGKSIPVDIVCLNSSSLQQQKKAFQGQGFIGQEQMNDAAEKMGWQAGAAVSRGIRIVVLHHHILPTTFSERPEPNYMYSVVLDEEALARWIVDHRINMVLHGHMHQPFCAKVSRPINLQEAEPNWHEFYVLGMGSSGVRQDHLGEVAKNTIGLLTFDRRSVTVRVLSVHPVNPSEKIWSIEIPLNY